MKQAATRGLTLIALTALAGLSLPAAHAAPSAESVASRLENVRRLIEVSSGAKRIEASGNAQAAAERARARSLHAQAEQALRAGDAAGANDSLVQATKAMFAGVRLAGAGKLRTDKERHDFESREESVRVLRDALQRIGREKGAQMRTNQVSATVDKMVREARALLAQERVEEARRVLDAAYEMAKTSIERLRGGDTLVRSLNFASAEEEYHYEVDRNDTHQMLIKVLLEEKRSAAGIDQMVQRFLDRASALRSEAESKAQAGDFKGAVHGLEQSTKELVRAIRSAGIYIPG